MTFVAVLLLLEGVALLAGGIAAVVDRDNQYFDLPVELAEIEEVGPFDLTTEPWRVVLGAGIVGIVLGLVVLALAVGLWRASSLAWGVVLVVTTLHLAGAVVASIGWDGWRRPSALGVVVVTLLVLVALLTPRARRFFLVYA